MLGGKQSSSVHFPIQTLLLVLMLPMVFGLSEILLENKVEAKAVPCNTTAVELLLPLLTATSECLATSTNSSADPSFCAPFESGVYCGCIKCESLFEDLLVAYGDVRGNRECELYLSNNNVNVGVARTALLLQRWPCFVARTDCSDPVLYPLCKPAAITIRAGLRQAGSKTLQTCLSAIETSCESDSTQPFCNTCLNGVCFASSVNTTLSPDSFVSLFDVMCSKTGPFSEIYLQSDGVSDYSVDLWTITKENDNSATVSNPVNLIPTFQDWKNTPVVFSQSNCTPGFEVVNLIGSVSSCRPGLNCPLFQNHVANVRYCPSGFYCSNPYEDPIPCPSGYFCPDGVTTPIKCSFLDLCPANAKVHVPMSGLVFLTLILVLGVVGYKLYRLKEIRRWNRDQAMEESLGAVVANVGESHSKLNLQPCNAKINIHFENIGVTIIKEEGQFVTALKSLTRHFSDSNSGEIASNNQSKKIMDNVTGSFFAGRVTAVMGPSGAGKTTLVSALLGKIKRSSGIVKINGAEDELTNFKNVVGFVPQEDVMLRELTVKEILTHSAKLRLPRTWTSEQVSTQIESVLHVLGLSSVRNTLIGDESNRGISGGQRKRVNIGIELVANPSVLILDEPTTGLDSNSALEVVKCLKDISNSGRTVIAIIHQPRFQVFQMFDDVLLLGKGGRTTFLGPMIKVIPYFESIGFTLPTACNPADFVMDILSGKIPRNGQRFQPVELFTMWESFEKRDGMSSLVATFVGADGGIEESDKKSPSFQPEPAVGSAASHENYPSLIVSAKTRQMPTFTSQFFVFLKRGFLQKYRSPAFLIIFVAMHLICAAALGAGFLQGTRLYLPPLPTWIANFCPPSIRDLCLATPVFNQGVFSSSFFLSVALGCAAVVVGVHAFGDEKPVYWRESGRGINRFAYFLAKNMVEVPWIILGALCFSGVLAPMLRPLQPFGELFLICVIVEFTAWGLGHFVSIIASKESAHVIGAVMVFAFTVCSGLTPPLKKIYDDYSVGRIIWDLSFPRYAAEAFYIREVRVFVTEDSIFTEPILRSLDRLGYDIDNFGFDLGILFLLGMGFRLLAYYFMVTLNRRQQK